MYIFSRRRLINPGRFRDAIGQGTEIAGTVTDLTGVPVMVWTSQYDPEGATMVWSARFETMAELDETFGKLMASESYGDQAEGLDSLFVGQPTDSLVQIVAGTIGETPPPLVSVVQAIAANGKEQEARAWGADVAEKVARSLSVPVAFGLGVWGHSGSMGWITAYENAEQLDDARGKLLVDATLQTVIEEGAETVQPGATNILLRRMN